MNALIVNCSGLGDGIIELPFLEGIGKSDRMRYFHTRGTLFRDEFLMSSLDLPGYAGTVPDEWRKFHESDWPSIFAFLKAENIELLINLRLIGPRFDTGYFSFKAKYFEEFRFINFDFEDMTNGAVNIRTKFNALFRLISLCDPLLERHCLRSLVSKSVCRVSRSIVVNMHTGSKFKRWCARKWRILCEELVERGFSLSILTGHTVEEQELAADLISRTGEPTLRRASLIQSTNVIGVLEQLASAECLISVDSWPVHAATGIGVRTIGLYVVSSPIIWGGDSNFMFPVASRHLQHCRNYDEILGICRNGYVCCPLIASEGDGIEVSDVLSIFELCALDSVV